MKTKQTLAVMTFLLGSAAIAVAGCGSDSTSDANPDDASTDGGTSSGSDAGSTSDAPIPEGDGAAGADAAAILAARPYTLHVPTGYDKSTPAPLVVMFHGYSATGAGQEAYFGLTTSADAHTFLYAYGDGTVDKNGQRFWNADDACCDLFHTGVDDVAYFDAIVGDVSKKYNVDPKRIFVIGHSNGGFMSHRLACDRAGTVAAIVSLAGAVWSDATKCAPNAPVSVAEVHGDADGTIAYGGGMIGTTPYPSATTTVATWANKNGCAGALTATGQTLDLDTTLPGSETSVQSYGGCPSGVGVELWTIHGGSHIPSFAHPAWGEAVWSFLSAHPKP